MSCVCVLCFGIDHARGILPQAAWNYLHGRFGGGPVLKDSDCCVDCIVEHCTGARASLSLVCAHAELVACLVSLDRYEYVELRNEFSRKCKRSGPADAAVWVPKAWVDGECTRSPPARRTCAALSSRLLCGAVWRRSTSPETLTFPINETITCEHGLLSTNENLRQRVSPEVSASTPSSRRAFTAPALSAGPTLSLWARLGQSFPRARNRAPSAWRIVCDPTR